MTDSTAGTGAPSQEPGGQQGQQQQQTPGQEQGQQQQGQQGTGQQGQALTMEQVLESIQDPSMKAYLAKVAKDAEDARRQAATERSRFQEAQQRATELERQNETDAERQQREAREREERLTALEQENRALKVGSALSAAATKANAFNPATVAGLLDARVEVDEQGNPTNLEDLLADLKRTDPYLFRRATTDAGEGQQQTGSPVGAGGMNDFIRGNARAGR